MNVNEPYKQGGWVKDSKEKKKHLVCDSIYEVQKQAHLSQNGGSKDRANFGRVVIGGISHVSGVLVMFLFLICWVLIYMFFWWKFIELHFRFLCFS